MSVCKYKRGDFCAIRTLKTNVYCIQGPCPDEKPMTNADKYFRNATDEEIASFLAAVNNHRQWSEQTLMQDLDADYAYYLDWLKREVPNAELD